MTDALWARLGVTFYRHPTTRGLSKDAKHLYLASILHSVEFSTDGHLASADLPLLAATAEVPLSCRDELVKAGKWIEQADSEEIEIEGFLDWQTSRTDRKRSSDKAKKAAEARWAKDPPDDTNGNAPSNALSNAKSMPSREEKSREDITPPSTNGVPDDFAPFWALYPAREGKKLDKAKAIRVWSRLSKAKKELAMTGVKHYAASGQMAKDAYRWLRDESWNDWQTPAKPDQQTQPTKPVIH